MALQYLSTPVITSRPWINILSPRGDGDHDFVTCAYNYPTANQPEYVVLHVEAGTKTVSLGSPSNYPNILFGYASANTSFTITNQLRGPDGKIYIPLRGVGDKFLAYFDPADHQVHECAAAAPPSGVHQIAYSATFNADGSRLYLGTQADSVWRPCVFEVNTTTQVVTAIGVYGTPDGVNPQYAYQLARDAGAGAGADLLYIAKGQAIWELIAVDVTDGTSTTLLTTGGVGNQRLEFNHIFGKGIRVTVVDNGVTTYKWLGDGVLTPYGDGSGSPTGGDRQTQPYENPLNPATAPEIDWSHGIGDFRYKLPAHYTVGTPDSSAWATIATAVGGVSAPSTIVQMQEASGNLADTGGAGRTFVLTSGTGLTHAQAETLWSGRTSIAFAEGQANRFTMTVPNANANSLLALLYVRATAIPVVNAAITSILESDGGYAEMTGVSGVRRIAAEFYSRVTGTTDPGEDWVPLWLWYDRALSAFTVIVGSAVISGATFGAATGTNLVLGGSGGTTTAPMRTMYLALWVGAAAEAWTLAKIQTATMTHLGWSAPIATPGWVQVTYTVDNIGPIPLESVTTLPNGDALVNAVQYNGFARFDRSTGVTTWFGQWPGGVSQPRTVVRDGFVWFSAYPRVVLYKFDPDAAWAPDGTISGNPSKIGNFAASGAEYCAQLVDAGALGLLMLGRKERDGIGSTLQFFDPVGVTFGASTDEDLIDYNPNTIVVLPDANRIVFSGRLHAASSISEARLQIYDLSLAKVGEAVVQAGWTDTGNVYPTASPSIVIGFLGATVYLFDVVAGVVLKTATMPQGDAIAIVQTEPEFVFVFALSGALVRIDTEILSITAFDDGAALANFSALSSKLEDVRRTFYAADGANLLRLETPIAPPPNKYTAAMMALAPPGGVFR